MSGKLNCLRRGVNEQLQMQRLRDQPARVGLRSPDSAFSAALDISEA
jgi:hypothetical protein